MRFPTNQLIGVCAGIPGDLQCTSSSRKSASDLVKTFFLVRMLC